MLHVLLKSAAVVAIVFTLSAPASGTIITIGDIKDATIFQIPANNSNGAGPGMFAGTDGVGSPRRGLIEFDIAGNVPAGSTINAVQLTLFLGQVAGSDATPRTIELHRLTADWGEGTTGSGSTMIGGTGQGFPANAGDATWNARFFPGTLWATPGGDFAASASASTIVDQDINDPYQWLTTAALVIDVQGWLNAPATNFGWALINAEENISQDSRAFYTRDFSNAAFHPQLQIDFTPAVVPAPATLLLIAAALAGWAGSGAGRRRCSQ